MTSARQQRKPRLAVAVLVWFAAAWAPLAQAVEKPILVDPYTGLAISGFDPVAYFTDGKPVFGRPDLELRVDGVIWRFRNEGDRAAFADHPEVYTPRFGQVTRYSGRSAANVSTFFIALTRARLFSSILRVSLRARRANGRRSRARLRAEATSPRQTFTAAALRGSPQATKAGIRKLFSACPNVSALPSGFVTRPPAAATTA
jgi:hypothetical protein